MTPELQLFTGGVLATGYAVAALFFLRFWRETRDRLFAFFAAAFAVLTVQTTALTLLRDELQEPAWLYAFRLLAYLLILAAIYDKNRARGVQMSPPIAHAPLDDAT